jgi:hypothetical protein
MQKVAGFCEQGNTIVAIAGTGNTSSNKTQGSFPSCTVTVHPAGDGVTLSTIFSDNLAAPTSKANPFTAGSDGTWFFYVANGRYDIVFSGGGIATPFTIGDVQAFDALLPVIFANLPTGVLGMLATVTDSNTIVWGATIAGSSTNKVLAFFNGTVWTVAGK